MMSDSRCDGVTDTRDRLQWCGRPFSINTDQERETADTLLQGLFVLYWYECLMVVLASENQHV